MIKNASPVNLVVIGLGLALIVFVAGVSTILALGQAVPTEMWAAGGAISGALIGLLVPAPKAAAAGQAAPPAQPGAVPQGQQAVAAQQPPGAQAQAGVQPQPGAQPEGAQAPAQPQPVQAVAAQQVPAQPQPVQPVAQQAQAQPQPVQPVAQPAANAPAGGATPSEPLSTHIAFVILLLIVFVLTLVGGVALSAGWIVPPSGFTETLHEATKVLIALASASGTALIGVFAPTSQHG